MKKVNSAEMRSLTGGATYSAKCKYCGKKFKTTYWGWSWIALQSAKVAVNYAKHNHEISCFQRYY